MTMQSPAARPSSQGKPSPPVLRVGSVSFLNAKPLIYGRDHDAGVDLSLEVPSRLLDGMRAARYDVALLPVIDYQRIPDLQIVPAGGIGCDGPTLTVRIFSPCPIEQISTLACDPDSHTSVALARIILAERHHVNPEFIDLTKTTGRPNEARLLIVATDRVSAFDVVMRETVPHKGAVLTQLTAWWLRQLEGRVVHHMLSSDTDEIAHDVRIAAQTAAPNRRVSNRDHHRCDNPDDADHNHHLDERVPAFRSHAGSCCKRSASTSVRLVSDCARGTSRRTPK